MNLYLAVINTTCKQSSHWTKGTPIVTVDEPLQSLDQAQVPGSSAEGDDGSHSGLDTRQRQGSGGQGSGRRSGGRSGGCG